MVIDARMPDLRAVKSTVSDVSERLRQAQAILAHAETRQGVRSVALHSASDSIALNARMVSAAPQENVADNEVRSADLGRSQTRIVRDDRIAFDVLDELHPVLPHGLPRGAVTCIQGSMFAALSLIVKASQDGAWVAVIGVPQLNYAAVQEAGIDVNKMVVIPQSPDKAPEVIAALIEGVELVVVGPSVALTRAEQRALSARARDRGAHLVVQQPWEGSRIAINVERGEWSGAEQGLGRINNCSYSLSRGDASGRSLRCTVRNVDGQIRRSAREQTGQRTGLTVVTNRAFVKPAVSASRMERVG